MKNGLTGLTLFAAGALLATGWAELHEARAGGSTAPASPAMAAAPADDTAPTRYALQAWEGCRPLQAGDAFTGPVTRSLVLSDGRKVDVSLAPATRENGARVFDTLVRAGTGSSRSQVGFQSPLLVDGVLLRAVDLDGASREVAGDAAYLHAPHPMAR